MHPRRPLLSLALSLAALAGLTCLPGCDDQRVVARWAELAADPDPVVFPETPVSTVRVRTVTLTNGGTGVVELQGLEITEDPEDFSLDVPAELVLPASIPPGQRVAFDVRYHPQAYPEADAGAVRVRSTDSEAPEYDLRLEGTAVQPVLLVEPVPVVFADTRVEATTPVTLTLTHTGSKPEPVDVTLLTLTDDGEGDFDIQDPPAMPTTLQAHDVLRVHLAYTPHAIDDGDEGVLTLESTAESQEHMEVPLLGASFAPHIEVSSTALSYGTVTQGANPSLPLTISNTGNQELHVTELGLSPTGSQMFELSPAALPDPIPPGGSEVVQVTYLADDRGDDDGTLRIFHDDPLEGIVFVQLHGRTPEPEINADPDFLTISISGISHTQTASIDIENLGDETLLVSGWEFDNPDGSFSLDSEPARPAAVEPGGAVTFVLRFTQDTATPDDTCHLTVHSDDRDEPDVVITAVGTYTP